MGRYVWEQSYWRPHRDPQGNLIPLVVVYGRNIDNPKEVKRFGFGGQRPFFYIPKGEERKLPAGTGEIDPETFTDAFGRAVRRVYTRLPSDVPKLRDLFTFTCEADILFDMRMLIDRGIMYAFDDNMHPINVPMLPPRVCYFDIETDNPEDVMPSVDDPKWPIRMIQCKDSYTKEKAIFTLGGTKVRPYQVICQTEEELYERWIKWIREYDFDIIAGWYSSGFDCPYIINRALRLRIDTRGLSRAGELAPSADRWQGRSLMDMLTWYKDWSKPAGQLPTYDLKFVVKHETTLRYEGAKAKGKEAPPPFVYTDYGDQISALVAKGDWETLVQYGENDVDALDYLDECTRLVSFYESLRRLVGIKFEDTLGRAKIIEYFLMHRGIKPLPTRKYDGQASDYTGALVLQPTPGVKEYVGTTDLKALYPTIILAYNVSPDVDKTIPKVIVELMEERERMRAIRTAGKADETLKTAEQSLKYIINSFYGYLAFTGARLHKPELAAFITAKGREIALALHEQARARGLTIVYGDTDSTFVTPIRSASEGLELQRSLNEYLERWACEHGIKRELAPTLKFEKLYRRILFKFAANGEEAAKKRYAGVLMWKEDKGDIPEDKWSVDYTGLEVKRSDTSEFVRDLMKKFFDTALVEADSKKAVQIVKEAYDEIKRGNVDCAALATPKGVHSARESPYTRGMDSGRRLLNIKFRQDKKPKLLYIKRVLVDGYPPFRELCVDDDTTDGQIREVCIPDWDVIAAKSIKQKFESLFTSIGESWDAHIHGQDNLAKWF